MTTTVHNARIADSFEELADLLAIDRADPFRVRAYRNAARIIREYPESMSELVRRGADLTELPGIGDHLAQKIRTLVESGRLPALEAQRLRTPAVLSALMKIPGLGPVRVRTLHEKLGVRSCADLERAARQGRVRTLPGFGAKTEARILAGLAGISTRERRVSQFEAEQIAAPLLAALNAMPGVERVTLAGSFRRRRDTVGDLDILVVARHGADVIKAFSGLDAVAEIVVAGATRATLRTHGDFQVDLRVVAEASYGAALHYFTGSKAHNIAIRTRAAERGLKINEYGVYRGRERIAGHDEAEIFASVGLPYIEPELREDRGEIAAADLAALPRLVTLADMRGDLHVHSAASDGHDDLPRLAAAARCRGYEYLAVSDHSRRVTIAHGLNAARLARQLEAIDRLNDGCDEFKLLKSCEVDILEDGSLDLEDKLLRRLDVVVCAVHYRLDLPRRRQTERILRAMDNPCMHILAHPGGRLINERPACDIDLERVIRAAAERGCCLEVNAHPARLDLNDEGCAMAREAGARVAIATDAHRIDDLDFIRFGLDQARRGWLTAADVINTRPLSALRKLLARR